MTNSILEVLYRRDDATRHATRHLRREALAIAHGLVEASERVPEVISSACVQLSLALQSIVRGDVPNGERRPSAASSATGASTDATATEEEHQRALEGSAALLLFRLCYDDERYAAVLEVFLRNAGVSSGGDERISKLVPNFLSLSLSRERALKGSLSLSLSRFREYLGKGSLEEWVHVPALTATRWRGRVSVSSVLTTLKAARDYFRNQARGGGLVEECALALEHSRSDAAIAAALFTLLRITARRPRERPRQRQLDTFPQSVLCPDGPVCCGNNNLKRVPLMESVSTRRRERGCRAPCRAAAHAPPHVRARRPTDRFRIFEVGV